MASQATDSTKTVHGQSQSQEDDINNNNNINDKVTVSSADDMMSARSEVLESDTDFEASPPPSPTKITKPGAGRKTACHSAPSDAFVTYYVDRERFQSKFLILPKNCQSSTKLSESIQKGGGIVVDKAEADLSPDEKQHLIKILDLDYIKSNVNNVKMPNFHIPYDTFSSNFIWSQIYLKSSSAGTQVGTRNADLNLYRVSHTSYSEYNANGVLQGNLRWEDIPMVPSHKLPSTISVKEVILQIFPELLLSKKMKSPKRHAYSKQESQLLLDIVCVRCEHARIHSMSLYKEIVQTKMPNRSHLSLKEHFLKSMLPRIVAKDGYYKVSDRDAKIFENKCLATHKNKEVGMGGRGRQKKSTKNGKEK